MDAVGAPARRRGRSASGVLGFIRGYPAFMLMVVAPMIVAVLYYGFIEANIYTSSAKFLIKEANQSSTLTGLGSFLQSTGISTTPNDAYTVDSYLTSTDAVRSLDAGGELRAVYNRPQADFLNRFPNFLYKGSFENLFTHYLGWTKVDFDPTSNITTLTVQAFTPGDAHGLAQKLLLLGEAKVNQMNERLRQDALKGARREVTQLQDRLLDVQNQITAFRNKEVLLDPTQTSSQSVTLLSTLESQLVTARAELNQQQVAAPRSPTLPGLRSRVAALQAQVAAESRKGAGGGQSLAPKLSTYQQLQLRQQFLQQMLQSAVTSLEAAEATIQQQQIYVARVQDATLPDAPYYPYRRLVEIVVAFVTLLTVYAIARLLYVALLEHRD